MSSFLKKEATPENADMPLGNRTWSTLTDANLPSEGRR
jgi:hypothetical protein